MPVQPRITILVGEFGSGKTEVAVHYALALAAQGIKTAIADLDIVKPYFCTRENRQLLERCGVYVAAPAERLAHAGLPVLPQELSRLFADASYQVVLDVGGGDSAAVLGQLRPQLEQSGYAALLVVNTLRPFTADSDGIIRSLRRIEQVSRLAVTGLLANTNLAEQTTPAHIEAGLAVVRQAAERLHLPVQGVVAPFWLKGQFAADISLLWLRPHTRYPWMEETWEEDGGSYAAK